MNTESVSTRIKRFDTGFIFMWIRLVFVKLKKLQNTLIQIKQDHRALNNYKKYYAVKLQKYKRNIKLWAIPFFLKLRRTR